MNPCVTATAIVACASGLWLCAWVEPPVVPRDAIKLAEERERKEQEDERRWRGTLHWTGWAFNDGVRLRAGLPRTIEIGVVFEVALEVESVPADAPPGRRWLFGGWPPTALMRFLDARGAESAEISEYTLDDSPWPFSVPAPDTTPAFDLTRPNHAFLKCHFVVPAAMGSIGPGRTDVCIRFSRQPQDVTGLNPQDAWTGEVATPPRRLDVRSGSTETRTFLLPARLRLRWRDLAEATGGKTSHSYLLVTYSEEDAEEVTLSYPKGASLYWLRSGRTPEGRETSWSLTGGAPQPGDVNGVHQWHGVVGPLERTYDLSLVYTLPAPRGSVPRPHGPTVLWSRTLTVSYDPKHPP